MPKGIRNSPRERLYGLDEMLFNIIPSSILVIDPSMRVVLANQNFFEKSKRVPSETIGHRIEDVFPPIILDQMNQRIRQVFEKGEATRGERITYRAPGLPMRIYYYKILPFSQDGQVESAVILMEDVSEQVQLSEEVRRAERHLAGVVESASDIVLSTDIDGRILTWNTAAENVSGFSSGEVKDHFLFEYCSENQEVIKGLFLGMETQSMTEKAEWRLNTKHRGAIPVSWVFSPMKDGQHRTTGIVAVGRDLTERQALEKQLLKSEKLAALGVMAGGIAHELRNPLAVCSSAAQFLLQDEISLEFRKECASKIHAAIQRASIIIENLLRFARPSESADMESLNLTDTVREAISLVANQANVQNIRLASCFPEKPLTIHGVPSLLQQVFINLFLNAINAMPNGGTLTVRGTQSDADVWIHVADTGSGISQAHIGYVFDPFFTTAPTGQGTGLGLSLCYSIVKQHLGFIDVESGEGKGTVFTVRFPIAMAISASRQNEQRAMQ